MGKGVSVRQVRRGGAGREEEEEEVRRAPAAAGGGGGGSGAAWNGQAGRPGLKDDALWKRRERSNGGREGGRGEGAPGGRRAGRRRGAGRGPPGPGALRAGGSWRRRSGAAGPGVGGRTARGRPGKELAAAASPKPAPLPSHPLPPPALTSHLLPSLFLPPSVPGGKACSSPSPGARRRGPSRAAFPPRPGSGRPRGLPTRGRP